MSRNTKWLKLQLTDDQRMESRYIILHTHFAIYAHLEEQGYQMVCYEASNYERNEPNAVLYIKTDHEGFYKSCCQYYAHDFSLDNMPADFEPPAHFRMILGARGMSQLAS